MSAVTRGEKTSEITHIFISRMGFVEKEKAHKIMWNSVDPIDVKMYLKTITDKPVPDNVINYIANILNGTESLEKFKAQVMKLV